MGFRPRKRGIMALCYLSGLREGGRVRVGSAGWGGACSPGGNGDQLQSAGERYAADIGRPASEPGYSDNQVVSRLPDYPPAPPSEVGPATTLTGPSGPSAPSSRK